MAERVNKIRVLTGIIVVILSVVAHFLLFIPKTRNYLKNWWQHHVAKTDNDKPKLECVSDKGAIESDLSGHGKIDALTGKAYTNLLKEISLPPEEKSAVKIIYQEFEDILRKGEIRSDINIITYWQKVFDSVNHPELFQKGLPYIRIALKPGIDKYKKDRRISAKEFARLALNALAEELVDKNDEKKGDILLDKVSFSIDK